MTMPRAVRRRCDPRSDHSASLETAAPRTGCDPTGSSKRTAVSCSSARTSLWATRRAAQASAMMVVNNVEGLINVVHDGGFIMVNEYEFIKDMVI